MPKFKHRSMQKIYDTCRLLALDKKSEMYHDGKPRGGAAHRNAYWNGRRGLPPLALSKGSLSYACWRAGSDDFKASGKQLP